MAKENEIGPTGQFPDGKAFPGDEGELVIGMAIDPERKLIVMDFGVLIAFKPEQAIAVADDLISKANLLMENPYGT